LGSPPLVYYCHSQGRLLFRGFRTRKLSDRRAVREDWAAPLPQKKLDLFKHVESGGEVCWVMSSISLDEGLRLLSRGSPVSARQCAANSAEFLQGLAAKILAVLDAMEKHGRHFGTLPIVKPLESSSFRGKAAQAAASWNNLLHRVLLSDRSRFFYKLQTLAGVVEETAREFFDSAEELVEGSAARPAAGWEALKSLNYDLNTCLCETIVVLKSFLRALPDEEVKSFGSRLDDAAQRVPLRVRSFTRIPA